MVEITIESKPVVSHDTLGTQIATSVLIVVLFFLSALGTFAVVLTPPTEEVKYEWFLSLSRIWPPPLSRGLTHFTAQITRVLLRTK